jgi:hypothetical protein
LQSRKQNAISATRLPRRLLLVCLSRSRLSSASAEWPE